MKKTTSAIFTALYLIGCSSITEDRQHTTLDAALFAYQTAMRWGNWDALLNYHNAMTQATEQQLAQLNNVQVTGYEIRQPPVFMQEQKVTQVVEIQYVLRDEQHLHKVLERQDWRYDADKQLWHLNSPLPKFR